MRRSIHCRFSCAPVPSCRRVSRSKARTNRRKSRRWKSIPEPTGSLLSTRTMARPMHTKRETFGSPSCDGMTERRSCLTKGPRRGPSQTQKLSKSSGRFDDDVGVLNRVACPDQSNRRWNPQLELQMRLGGEGDRPERALKGIHRVTIVDDAKLFRHRNAADLKVRLDGPEDIEDAGQV